MRQDQVDTQNGSYNQQQQQPQDSQQQQYAEEQSYNVEPQQQQQQASYQTGRTLEPQEPVQPPVQYVIEISRKIAKL